MTHYMSTYIFILLVGAGFAVSANTASEKNRQKTEIQHLLTFIDHSNCIFIRNGDEHKAQKARKHIEQKYNYYKDDVHSAEDFIKYAATKSGFSGKQYMARCNGKTIPSSQWLLDELSTFRKQHRPNN